MPLSPQQRWAITMLVAAKTIDQARRKPTRCVSLLIAVMVSPITFVSDWDQVTVDNTDARHFQIHPGIGVFYYILLGRQTKYVQPSIFSFFQLRSGRNKARLQSLLATAMLKQRMPSIVSCRGNVLESSELRNQSKLWSQQHTKTTTCVEMLDSSLLGMVAGSRVGSCRDICSILVTS